VAKSVQDVSPSCIQLTCQPYAFGVFSEGAVGMTELLEHAVTERLEFHILSFLVREALLERLNTSREVEFDEFLRAAVFEQFGDQHFSWRESGMRN
jgi:hypothetical protein